MRPWSGRYRFHRAAVRRIDGGTGLHGSVTCATRAALPSVQPLFERDARAIRGGVMFFVQFVYRLVGPAEDLAHARDQVRGPDPHGQAPMRTTMPMILAWRRGRDASVGPDRVALLQERGHALAGAGRLGQRRHHLDGDRVRVGLGAVQLGVERLLADALAEPAAPGGPGQQLVDRGRRARRRAPRSSPGPSRRRWRRRSGRR